MPRGLYRVRLDDGRIVTATIGRELRRVLVRITPGDRVLVEPSEVDPTRGRIIEKQK
ncbi:MAG: translation initiation factor IF-1 [Deltaproteobacteria bacterium]|nr:translation initiation factor IF-1 [Deltaproteobacteria bacterium]